MHDKRVDRFTIDLTDRSSDGRAEIDIVAMILDTSFVLKKSIRNVTGVRAHNENDHEQYGLGLWCESPPRWNEMLFI